MIRYISVWRVPKCWLADHPRAGRNTQRLSKHTYNSLIKGRMIKLKGNLTILLPVLPGIAVLWRSCCAGCLPLIFLWNRLYILVGGGGGYLGFVGVGVECQFYVRQSSGSYWTPCKNGGSFWQEHIYVTLFRIRLAIRRLFSTIKSILLNHAFVSTKKTDYFSSQKMQKILQYGSVYYKCFIRPDKYGKCKGKLNGIFV